MNRYEGVLEDWKQDVILERARRRGLRGPELEDAQQTIVPYVQNFKYDPAKSNGATEANALRVMIDNQLAFMHRSKVRAGKHLKKLCDLKAIRTTKDFIEPRQNNETYQSTLKFDIQAILKNLTQNKRVICSHLSKGLSRVDVAEEMGISRNEVNQEIEQIRDEFVKHGFSMEWFNL